MGDISSDKSMEDILSSIKRIIAEEGEGAAARAVRRPRPAPLPIADADDDEDGGSILELDDFADREEPRAERAAEAPREEPVPAFAERKAETILSDRAAEATRGSLEALSRLVVRPETPGSDTLEGLVADMLRPMLRDWLDANLPKIVERMVQREIERIANR